MTVDAALVGIVAALGLLLAAAGLALLLERADRRRERAEWTQERINLVEAAARTSLGVPPPPARHPRGEREWAEADRRRRERLEGREVEIR